MANEIRITRYEKKPDDFLVGLLSLCFIDGDVSGVWRAKGLLPSQFTSSRPGALCGVCTALLFLVHRNRTSISILRSGFHASLRWNSKLKGNEIGAFYSYLAMNATKRKFNTLLTGIGNKSTTSLPPKDVNNTSSSDPLATMSPTTVSDGDSQAKKRRVAPITSTGKANALSRAKSSATAHKKSASLASNALEADAPKYAPWDRVAFLARLKSFSNITDWTPKPPRVNEVEWAKRGWVCQKSERVRCCLCNVEILVKLNRKEVDGKEEPVYVAQNIGRQEFFRCKHKKLTSSRKCSS